MSEITDEIATWYKALNFERMKKLLSETLPKQPQRLVYQLTEEKRSTREIEKLTVAAGSRVPFKTVSEWQVNWVQKGLVMQISPHKRQRLFDLNHFGLEPTAGKQRSGGADSNSGEISGE